MEKETYEIVIETLAQQLSYEKWKLKQIEEELEKKNKALEQAHMSIGGIKG